MLYHNFPDITCRAFGEFDKIDSIAPGCGIENQFVGFKRLVVRIDFLPD